MSGERTAGILLHPTSLPGPGGAGSLGPEAFRFLDRLRDSGQRLWQVLPLGPTGYGDSPYQSFSSFAGSPLLVSPERLREEGLVTDDELSCLPEGPEAEVDYGAVLPARAALLDAAHRKFVSGGGPAGLARELEGFRDRERGWLEDFCLFTAIHEDRDRRWAEWPEPLALREPSALREASARFRDRIQRHAFVQLLFFRHWEALHRAARQAGIRILGDLPLFAAHDSADVWAAPEIFRLDAHGEPEVLAGAPPDDFTRDGQLWGNPLYRWDLPATSAWWVERVRAALKRYDLVRLDHFRGFVGCWEVPAGAKNARRGKWTRGPGRALFERLRQELGEVALVAEDLGDITDEVRELRKALGLPGMRVLHFGYGKDRETSEHAPQNLVRDCIAYTGSHDNDTTQGWWRAARFAPRASQQDVKTARKRILAATGGTGATIHRDLSRIALESVAETAVLPVQDVLGLGSSARMNRPGKERGNWTWRMRDGDRNDAGWDDLAELTRSSGR